MKKIGTGIVLLLCLVLLIAGCGQRNTAAAEGSAQEEEAAVMVVSTPFADLKVPARYQDHVTNTVASESPYTLVFQAADDGTELYRLIINGDEGDLIGTLVGETENYVLRLVMPALDTENEHFSEHCEYQEGFSTIVDHLRKDYEFVLNEIIEAEDPSTFVIHTSLTDLHYPSKWQDKVQIDTSEDGVVFSVDGTTLFELRFSECDGYLLGTYQETPIYIVEHEVNGAEQADMVDDVNVILEHLMEDANFSMNH